MTDAVAKRSAAACEMQEHLPMILALLGGTSAMRKAGAKFLPKWPQEEQEAYNCRLGVTTLFPAFNRTVEVLSAKPFSKALTLGDDVPSRLKTWCDDIDLQGRNLQAFAASLCEDLMGPGFCGVLVDYPPAEGVRTQADEAAAGVRPYFVHVKVGNVLGWKAKVVNGAWVLMQLRLMECTTEDDGPYGEKVIEQVRVLEPGKWELWRKRKDQAGAEEWFLHLEGVTTLKEIPFVPLYGKRIAFMVGAAPLLDLAFMNIEHWQSKSDQQNILHVARVPILAVIGDEEKKSVTVGSTSAVHIPLGGDMKFVEHTGKAIEAGRLSLLDLEDRMRQAGAELLVIKPANQTQVQTLSDNEQGRCAMQRIAEDLEDGIDQALQLMAEWVGEKSGGHVTIFKDFGALSLAEASGELLLKSAQTGKLSDETYRSELKRRGTLSPDVDEEEEKRRLEEQPPPLGTITPDDDDEGAGGNGE